MYLSRLILNPCSHQVQREIADIYQMHRTVMHAFADRQVEKDRVLFRLDIHPRTEIPSLLVQSKEIPDWSFLLDAQKDYLFLGDDLPVETDNPAVEMVNLLLMPGQVTAFRLRAFPSKRFGRGAEKLKQKRVALLKKDEQLGWLKRKLEAAGAVLLSANISNIQRASGALFRDDDRHVLNFISVQYDGILQVNDPQQLKESIVAGFGSGKGLGFGLLSLAPARG